MNAGHNLSVGQAAAITEIRELHTISNRGSDNWWIRITPTVLPAEEVVLSYDNGQRVTSRWAIERDGQWTEVAV